MAGWPGSVSPVFLAVVLFVAVTSALPPEVPRAEMKIKARNKNNIHTEIGRIITIIIFMKLPSRKEM